MGANCCQTCQNLQIEHFPSSPPNISNYQQSNWPDNPQLHSLLQFSKIFKPSLKRKPLKHKIYDRWFWGVWKDGYPYGIGILYQIIGGKGEKGEKGKEDSSVFYQGEFQGEPDGIGRVVFNGWEWEYEGEVRKGKANGLGSIFNKKEGFKFEGEWKQSKPLKGTLTLFNTSGSQAQPHPNTPSQILGNISIKFDNSQPHQPSTITYPDGKIYKGEINKYKYIPQGYGQLTFANKNKYEGQWVEGEMSGEGKFYWEDGSWYQGEYFGGRKNGIGRFYYVSGNFYDGFWKDGRQEGRGVLYDKHKNQLKNGIWANGVFQSQQS